MAKPYTYRLLTKQRTGYLPSFFFFPKTASCRIGVAEPTGRGTTAQTQDQDGGAGGKLDPKV